MIKWTQIERIRAITFTFMHGLKKIYKVLFLIIEKSEDAVLHTITVDSRYLEIEGTLKNTSRYPYFDISDL